MERREAKGFNGRVSHFSDRWRDAHYTGSLRLFRLQHLLSLQREKIGATPAVETSPPSFHFACSCASSAQRLGGFKGGKHG
jgi:hypothetical protein